MAKTQVRNIHKGGQLIFRGETYTVLDKIQIKNKNEEPFIAWTLADAKGEKVGDTLQSSVWGFFETPDT